MRVTWGFVQFLRKRSLAIVAHGLAKILGGIVVVLAAEK